MTTATVSEKLKALAPDLTKDYPRSPRETLAGYILAPRALDKCRATLNGTNGEYNYNCPLDRNFFDFTGIDADAFRDFVATGAGDEEVAGWIRQHAKQGGRIEIVKWNNTLRYMTIDQMPDQFQLFMEDYIPQVVPKGKVVRHFLDVLDIEEGRL